MRVCGGGGAEGGRAGLVCVCVRACACVYIMRVAGSFASFGNIVSATVFKDKLSGASKVRGPGPNLHRPA